MKGFSLILGYLFSMLSNSTAICQLEITNQFQTNTNQLVSDILSNHFVNCDVTHFRSQDEYGGSLTRFNKGYLTTTVINTNLWPSKTFFKTFDRYHVSQHSRQCKVYFISDGHEQPEFLTTFTNPSLKVQAQQSYLLLKEDVKTKAEEILFLPILSSFQHRIWLQPFISKSQFPPFAKLNHHFYCYTCSASGKQALVAVQDPIRKKFQELFPEVVRNLNGFNLICSAPQAPPLVAILKSKVNINALTIVGMQEIILKETAKKLNFTFTLLKATDGATGIPLPNGSWTGIMGQINNGLADIGISVSTSYERNRFFEFTVPVFHAFLVLVSVKPLPHFDWEAIFYPFDKIAWAGILVSTIVSVALYKLIYNKSVQSKSRKMSKISTFKSAYLAIGALVEQGIPLKFASTPSRIHAGCWFLLAIVVTCAYRSKLFMFLTFPTSEKPISSLKELSESDYSWGMKSLGGVGLLLITKSPLAHSRYVGENLELSFDKYSCLDKTFTHRFVCIIYRAYIDYMSVVRYWKINHKFHISDYVTSSVGSSWVLPKYSPLLTIVDQYHISQFEMGLANKYLETFQQDFALSARAAAQASNSTEDIFDLNTNFVRDADGPKPLQLGNLAGAFVILLVGIAIAFGLFSVELIRAVIKSRKERKLRVKHMFVKAKNIRRHVVRI